MISSRSCWAACLGGCTDKPSREHLISASLFINKTVRVQGFPWCEDSPKEIALAGLTAKILCGRHNNDLSDVDTVGAQAFSAFRKMMELSNVRKCLRPHPWNVVRYAVDGKMLERWFLKTLINLCCDRGYPIGRIATVTGRPAEHVVRIAYGLSTFEGKAGLYSIVYLGMNFNSEDYIGFSPLINPGGCIEGGLFVFRGFRFLLFLEPDGPPEPLTGIGFAGEDLGSANLIFHHRQINEKTGKFRSQSLNIKWDSTT